MLRLTIDGKTAVLVATKPGAGWSTWNPGLETELAMDSELVSLVLNNKAQAALNLAVEKYGEKSVSYCGESIHVGRNMAASLSVTWVPSDELFQIREGEDGTETIILFRDMQFLRA